jgi:hypothetical protein
MKVLTLFGLGIKPAPLSKLFQVMSSYLKRIRVVKQLCVHYNLEQRPGIAKYFT